MNSDDDLDFLTYINSNNKLINNSENKDTPPKKRMKISENNSKINLESRENKMSKGNKIFSVEKVITENSHIELVLKRLNECDGNDDLETRCYLYDSWTSFNVEPNDNVHLLVDQESDGTFKITDYKGHIILNPHYVLSGTAVISSLFCLRKSALNWKFKESGSGNHHMILGTILHNLFQQSISNKKYERNELKSLLLEMLKQKKIINQLYECDKDKEFILKETEIYLQSIEKWLHEHVKIPLGHKKPQMEKNLQIQNICDIEESIWSPKYGIKGKIDLTLQLEIKMSAYSSIAKKTTEKKDLLKTETHVVPVELKSGRTTFSAEHEGQVMLYSVLNKEKRKASDFGLLLYLKDMKMKFIKVSDNSIRGLIQLRNELVYYISSSKFPVLKNDERTCSKCAFLTVCSLFNKKSIQTDETYERPYKEIELYSNSIQHLTQKHEDYFFKWYEMLESEFKDQKQFESGKLIWWKSKEDLEAKGWTVFDLKNVKAKGINEQNVDKYDGEGFFPFTFKKTSPSSSNVFNLKENDMVLVSSQTDNMIGISQGFIKSIYADNTSFTINLDKNLSMFKTSNDHLFRIDKINYRSAIQLNYTNLGRLMEEKHSRIREYIIDKKTPEFEKVLPKQNILKTKSFFKTLNQSQQAAILKAMMAKDFLLIKGYPGTGKTTTIAALIAILTKLEKKVLFCCFTNSAVDNLLVKLSKDYPVDFLRIGSYEKIHPDIQKYELNSLLNGIDDTEDLKKFYNKKELFATTCSSITHSVFQKIDFDYCIIDEASQVLLTTCLGPLFSAKKFILVGDLEQLPPIVKSKESREMGMGVSLFEWLDSKQASVELVHQYRMNNDIMDLANVITYCGKLKCISESTATGFIRMNDKFLNMLKSEKIKRVFTSPVIFIDTTELITSSDFNDKSTNTEDTKKLDNSIECDIVSNLCNIFSKHSECNNPESFGVIAPYNAQVNAIQSKFARQSFFQDIEVSTVDQFQGRDKRIVMMSFTNSKLNNEETKEFEILNDKRRLTVAITRAKEKLILIGCVNTLLKYKELSIMIKHLEEKNLIVKLTNVNELIDCNV